MNNPATCPIQELEAFLRQARDAYYNSTDIINDTEYDYLEDILRARKPDSALLSQVGADILEFDPQKTKLPKFMPSMDKVNPGTDKLGRWLAKHPGEIHISHKLDGLSGLFVYPNLLYTRGNGTVGLNISHFIEHLRSLMNIKNVPQGTIVRGELIISKENWKLRRHADIKNPRNMVSGLITSKHPDPEDLRLVDFVAYQVLSTLNAGIKPSEQFRMLQSWNFLTAQNWLLTESPTSLSNQLTQAKQDGPYQIDGLILSHNQVYPEVTEKLPTHAIAFKQNAGEGILTTVIAVHWTTSRWGVIKPTLEVEPIDIIDTEGGLVTVRRATAFNAKYILDNKLGPGSQVRIIRSGDVIPYISEIVHTTEASLPDAECCQWNETGVDLILKAPDDNVLVEGIIYFFKTMETKYISTATVTKMVEAGYRTIPAILQMTAAELAELPGFAGKSAANAFQSLSSVLNDVSEAQLMAASGKFGQGMGKRKMQAVLDVYPDFASWHVDWQAPGGFTTPDANIIANPRFKELIAKIVLIPGFQTKTASKVVYNLPAYQAFVTELSEVREIRWAEWGETPEVQTDAAEFDHPNNFWINQHVVFSGFRDSELEKEIVAGGGKVQTTVNQKTTLVLVKDINSTSGKTQKALELGIAVRVI